MENVQFKKRNPPTFHQVYCVYLESTYMFQIKYFNGNHKLINIFCIKWTKQLGLVAVNIETKFETHHFKYTHTLYMLYAIKIINIQTVT